ncbi:NAD(P)H-dependent glycerol-3-phosphate dehydrogenase [Georgenia thermotolerans]|uniref:Glycerol-3-phosphate dehydrogenase [NAD(P)+] n=1 Tax=Georgenia thermotolerans TaxID=527326 RepID=A0A7J5UJ54_9MICO|nr:NAD(P)H-dependent glycerol-3-phosphate dehydrogenase [Georgenia thermotolerans]KAE8762425.1 NAD(P)H-dependent glycerol-3-phosphate dehydrogenase [Georgenia thermotolerans]
MTAGTPAPAGAEATPLRTAVLGTGAWGTTFAAVLADAGCAVRMWGRSADVVEEIASAHRNTKNLPGVALPASLTATTDLAGAVADADVVVVAIPAQSVRRALAPLAGTLPPDVVVVSLMKGVELGTDLRMSQVLAAALAVAPDRVAVVSGPNLAKEIVAHQPAGAVVAAEDPEVAKLVARACAAPYFRPYIETDVVGVELGGAVKNVIALAVGMAQGRGYGDNTKATLITRGLAEISRLGAALGARPATFAGLAGMGDLVATCASPLSRNHTLGAHLGAGRSLDEAIALTGGTAEGVKSCRSVLDLARRHGVDMPITEAVVAVLHEGLPVAEMTRMLLDRPLKHERA